MINMLLGIIAGFCATGWFYENKKRVALENKYQEIFEIISMKLGELSDKEKYGTK